MPREFTPRERPGGLLPRPDADDEPLVTLVCAPAGFGKTTLLSSWVRQVRTEPVPGLVAWLTADESDNDAAVLNNGIVSAVGNALARATDDHLPHQRARKNDPVAEVADLMDGLDERLWLVLDDIDRLHTREALELLARLVRWMPANLRLVLSCRREPPVPLHRVHLAGRLREIRARDLEFTEEETREVVCSLGIELPSCEMRRLTSVTQGWPAATRLIALGLTSRKQDTPAIASVVATDRAIASFLETDVLLRLSAEQQDLLLRTSVCTIAFDTDLAASLTGRANEDIVALLESADGLVSRSGDGARYCVQPFVRSYLRAKLERQSPEHYATLSRVAAIWYRQKGDSLVGARHAAHSADHDLITDVLAVDGPALLLRGELDLFRSLVDALPGHRTARADVGLIIALGELTSGDRVAADLRVSGLAGALETDTTQRVRDLELIVRTHSARLTGTSAPGTGALDDLVTRASSADLLVFALVNRGTTAFWLGDTQRAGQDLEKAMHIAISNGFDLAVLHCLSHLAGVAAATGHYPRMQGVAQQALRFAEERGALSVASCFAYTVAAWGAHQFLERDNAMEFSAKAVGLLGGNNDRTVELCALSIRAVVEFEYGDNPYAALVRLREIWQDLSPAEPVQPNVLAYEALAENRMTLRLGRADWAAEAERRFSMRVGETGETLLMRAHLHAHHGRVGPARALLERVTTQRSPSLVQLTRLEAHLLAAVLAERGDDRKNAQAEVVAAIELAEPMLALRPFVEAGGTIRGLLVSQLGRLGRLDAFAERVVAVLPAEQSGVATELTPREIQLLRELPSLATIDEIAAALYVSVNTVKTHLRNVYRKLGVASRREAVVVGRQRGLL